MKGGEDGADAMSKRCCFRGCKNPVGADEEACDACLDALERELDRRWQEREDALFRRAMKN